MVGRRNQQTAREVPYDREAEESIAGAVAVFRNERDMLDQLTPEDFYIPQVGQLWGAMQDLHDHGATIDHVTLGDVYAQKGWEFDASWFVSLQANTPSAPRMEHVEIILRHATARRLIAAANESIEQLYGRADPYEISDDLGSAMDVIGSPKSTGVQLSRTIEDVIEHAEETSPWVIPGLFRTDWRVIVVAGEGHGKSVLSRQIAICASQGIHPFTHRPIDPIRVLIIDLENPDAAVAETGERMIRQAKVDANGTYDAGRVMYHSRIEGIDLRNRRDKAEIENEIAIHRPDLVIIGPAYLMTPKHLNGGKLENDEDSTLPVLMIMNDLRKRYRFAMMIEHHAPNGNASGREMRPMGSVRWRAWSEIGISMSWRKDSKPATYDMWRYRGDRLKNQWPDVIAQASVWPWDGSWPHGMPSLVPPPVGLPMQSDQLAEEF